MENNILLVDEKEKENARALTQSFVKKDVRSRAYTNVLGAEVCMQYLKDENIIDSEIYNIHSIRKFLEEFDISDIMLANIHIDVRVVYNENEIFIPKSHFEYNLVPDLYIVLKINNDYSQTEFLGFFEPKMLNKNNTNGEYYFIEKEKLSSPVDLKNFINNFKGSTSKEYSETELDDAEFLFISMADNSISNEDKKKLLDYLKNSASLRDRFIEFENFEMLSYKTANDVAFDDYLEDSSKEEQDNIEITEENNADSEAAELDTDIFDDTLDTADVFDENLDTSELSVNDLNIEDDNQETSEDNSGNGLIGDMLAGTAIAGAEIAGAAMASAALTGAAETAESISGLAGAADAVAGIAETASDVVSDAVDALAPNNTDSQSVMGMTDTLDELNSMDIADNAGETSAVDGLTDGIDGLLSELTPDNTTGETTEQIAETPSEIQDISVQEEDTSSSVGSLEDLFGDTSSESSFDDGLLADNVDFGSSDSSDDVAFEDSSDDLVFSNNDDYDDDLIFENNDDYDDSQSSVSSSSSGGSISSVKQGIPAAINTPISEATELVSLENIQLGNLPPMDIPSDIGSQMETMEMDEFHRLVNNYVPTEIKDESVTIDFNNIEESVLPNSTKEEDFVDDEILDVSNTAPATTSPETKKDEVTSDDFAEDMPEEINDLSAIKKDDLTSDDFMEDMPEEIKDLSSVKTEDLIPDESMDNMSLETEGLSVETPQESDMSTDFDEDIFGISDSAATEASVADADDFFDAAAEKSEQDALPEGVDFNSGLNIGELPDESIDQSGELISEIDGLDEIENLGQPDEISAETSFADEEDVENTASQDVVENIDITEEAAENVSDDLSLLDDISALDDISSGQEFSETDDFDDEEALPTGFTPINSNPETEGSLGMLYADSDTNIDSQELENENYDFRPKRKFSLMPVFAFVTVAIIAATVVGFLVKNKNSIDSETLIQSAPENEILESPENDNSNVLANQEIVPAIPTDESSQQADKIELSKDAKQDAIKEAKEAVKQQNSSKVIVESKKPLNANKNITLKKLSWQLPNYLSHSMNMNKYLQAAGKSIKLTLSSDLLLTNEYIYSNMVKVNLKLSNDGTIQTASVVSSSGSEQVDKIVLQTVKDTLNVVKPVRGEVPTKTFNLALIIYL